MACLILTSCTEGNTTKLVTLPAASLSLIPFIGQHVSIIGYPGICFSVEQTENPCVDCEKAASIIPIAGNPVCSCTIPFLAYILTPCEGSGLPTLYTTQNLYAYVGTSITFFGQAGVCYTVVGSLNIPQESDFIDPVIVECPIACNCVPVICGCPDGYILNEETGLCEGTLEVEPTGGSPLLTVIPAISLPVWGNEGARFYDEVSTLPKPLTAIFSPAPWTLVDNINNPCILDSISLNVLWTTRLETTAVWAQGVNQGDPAVLPIGFSLCQDFPESKVYYFGMSADDYGTFTLDGTLILDVMPYVSWVILPIFITAGTHIIEITVQDAGSVISGLGFEIYDAPDYATLQACITANGTVGPTDLNQYILFSTLEKLTPPGQTWDIGTNSGYTCPDGYTLSTCGPPMCIQNVTVPQVPCFAWEITFCEGTGLDPIITSTDLTQYTGDGDVYEITYTSGPTTIVACGSVAQAPAQTAPAFTGTFSEIIYDCCESCMAVCYLLEDCQEAVPSMILCTDLKDYVGKIIKIAGCGNICWTVSEASSCEGSIKFEGEVTEFDTCLECLPPVPVPVPLELNLRKVKPGYNSPNSCVTLEYLQRVNCNFALQVYNEMLIKRYGITVCCDQDVDTWDIQKSELDYMLMGDPSLCKSTLCDCKAPCLIDVIFALVPTCVSPVIYSTIFSLDCGDPVLVSAEIEAPVIYDCLCYPVRLTVSPTTVSYYNCCCEYVSEVMTSSGNICAITTPTSLTNPINIGTVVECGSEDCGVPACNCYTVTADVGQNAQVDYINCDGSPIQLRSLPGTYSFCAIAPPTVTNATFVDNGPCISNQSCANVNDDCTCYNINITNGTGTFAYVNCSNVIQLSVIVGTGRVCAKTVPILLTPSGVQSTINIPSGVFCSGNECLPIP